MKAIQYYYPKEFRVCYGCGTENEHGHHVESHFDGDEVVAHFKPKDYHTAFPGIVYGGLIASLIDCHGIGAAAAFAYRAEGHELGEGPIARYATGKLEVSFKAPTPMGQELELRARELERGERKVIVAVTVSAGGQVTAEGKVVAVRMK